jgi:hypothetical protein
MAIDFSVIVQDPAVRDIVQTNLLQRQFHDSLYPRGLFRAEAVPQNWQAQTGDTQLFTGVGLMQPNLAPLRPGTDPTPKTYPLEQWEATMQQWADSVDVDMPTSMVAIASLFVQNAKTLGLQAAMSINRRVRDTLYNAALSGETVTDGIQGPTPTIQVMRLNGFTSARNPNLANGSQVRFATVSSSNPLAVQVFDSGVGGFVDRNVIAFEADTPGDLFGPGTITLNSNVTVADRACVRAVDRTEKVRVGGGNTIDSIGAGDIPDLGSIRDAVAILWNNEVSEHVNEGRFHCHADPTSINKLYAGAEFQRLNTSLPDYYMYRDFAVGELLNVLFYRNTECPVANRVLGGSDATYNVNDPFGAEIWTNGSTTTGIEVHRMLLTAQGGLMEYYADLAGLVSDAGLNGKVATPNITNNGIVVNTDRIEYVIRAPLDRLQSQVSISWRFMGTWVFRTDAASAGIASSRARYKRAVCIEHGA